MQNLLSSLFGIQTLGHRVLHVNEHSHHSEQMFTLSTGFMGGLKNRSECFSERRCEGFRYKAWHMLQIAPATSEPVNHPLRRAVIPRPLPAVPALFTAVFETIGLTAADLHLTRSLFLHDNVTRHQRAYFVFDLQCAIGEQRVANSQNPVIRKINIQLPLHGFP